MLLENKVEEAEKELQKLITLEGLEITIEKTEFPIKATVKNIADNQMSIMGASEKFNGHIEFVFENELIFKIKDFKISDDLLNRIKNRLKKWHYAYLELFFEKSFTDWEGREWIT